MSTQGPRTITSGGYVEQDENEELVYEFDYDTELLGAGVQLTGYGTFEIVPSGLTSDNPTLVNGNRRTRIRLSGGTAGKRYRITNRVVTNELPSQKFELEFYLRITE